MKRFIRMHDADMVATALQDVREGDTAIVCDKANQALCRVDVLEHIPPGNKIALADIAPGDKVVKYGAVIGQCTAPIQKGRLVHVHNLRSLKLDVPSAIQREIIRQMGIEAAGGPGHA